VIIIIILNKTYFYPAIGRSFRGGAVLSCSNWLTDSFSTKFMCDFDDNEHVHEISLCRHFAQKSYILQFT